MTTLPPELQEAHQLFLKEIEDHFTALTAAAERAAAADSSTLIADRKSALHRLHLLKGGAGFFGLGQLQELASVHEKNLKLAGSEAEIKALLSDNLKAFVEAARKLVS